MRQLGPGHDAVLSTVTGGQPSHGAEGILACFPEKQPFGLSGGSANLAGYSATKGAVRLFAKSIALECARDNIRVNSVHPGVIDTPIWTKLPVGANAPLDPNLIAAATVPIGMAGLAEDIANGVLFLCSDASGHMTGSEMVIDGGMTAGRVGRLGG